MVDRPDKGNVPKMSGTLHLGAHTRLAKAVFVHRSHEVIIDSVSLWVSRLLVCDLLVYASVSDRLLRNVLL